MPWRVIVGKHRVRRRVDVCRLKISIESSLCQQACRYNTSLLESTTLLQDSRSPKARACASVRSGGATVWWRVCANFMCDITLHCWRFTSFSSLLEESRGVAQSRGDECMHARTYVRTYIRLYARMQADRQSRRERQQAINVARLVIADSHARSSHQCVSCV